MLAKPEVRFTRSADQWLAYTTYGSGALDVVFVSPLMSNIDVMTEAAELCDIFSGLAALGRLVLWDRRGAGLSDPVPGLASTCLQEWCEDLHNVLIAVGAREVCLFGLDSAAPYTLLFAATYPDRVRSIALVEPTVPFAGDFGGEADADAMAAMVDRHWGEAAVLAMLSPALVTDPATRQWWARFERSSMSRATAREAWRDFLRLDVRPAVPLVQAPVLIVRRRQPMLAGRPSDVGGAWLTATLPNSHTVLIDHPDVHWWWDRQLRGFTLDEVAAHFTGQRGVSDHTRALATVLFSDLVASTERAVDLGDRAWRRLLDAHDAVVSQQIEAHGGSLVKSTGDGVVATFDMPARAVRCAAALRRHLRDIDLDIRVGIHTGEIELRHPDIGGLGVHLASRIQTLAAPGEILVSRTVRDLVVGSGLRFVDRGDHQLKGVPEPWRLLSLADDSDDAAPRG